MKEIIANWQRDYNVYLETGDRVNLIHTLLKAKGSKFEALAAWNTEIDAHLRSSVLMALVDKLN